MSKRYHNISINDDQYPAVQAAGIYQDVDYGFYEAVRLVKAAIAKELIKEDDVIITVCDDYDTLNFFYKFKDGQPVKV